MTITELLNRPERWTKGSFARRSDATVCHTENPDACSWCLMGAAGRCYNLSNPRSIWNVVDSLETALVRLGYHKNILAFNDAPETTFEDIQRVLLEAGNP